MFKNAVYGAKELPWVNSTNDPVFNLRFFFGRIWGGGVVLYNMGYQMIELFILLQLIQVLTPGSNLINFYEDQTEVGVRTSVSHK